MAYRRLMKLMGVHCGAGDASRCLRRRRCGASPVSRGAGRGTGRGAVWGAVWGAGRGAVWGAGRGAVWGSCCGTGGGAGQRTGPGTGATDLHHVCGSGVFGARNHQPRDQDEHQLEPDPELDCWPRTRQGFGSRGDAVPSLGRGRPLPSGIMDARRRRQPDLHAP